MSLAAIFLLITHALEAGPGRPLAGPSDLREAGFEARSRR